VQSQDIACLPPPPAQLLAFAVSYWFDKRQPRFCNLSAGAYRSGFYPDYTYQCIEIANSMQRVSDISAILLSLSLFSIVPIYNSTPSHQSIKTNAPCCHQPLLASQPCAWRLSAMSSHLLQVQYLGSILARSDTEIPVPLTATLYMFSPARQVTPSSRRMEMGR
jgi:hypothetical protein